MLLSPLAVVLLLLSAAPPAADVAVAAPPAPAAGHRATGAPGSAADAADAHALRLLERASKAPATTAYHGVQFVSAWTEEGAAGLVVNVSHRPGAGTFVRSDATVQTAASASHVPEGAGEPSLGGSSRGLALLAANFALRIAGRADVAGRATEVVEVRRRDGQFPAARFWLDQQTGIVLRREVYDERGRTTRASAFVEVEVGQAASATGSATTMAAAWPHEVDPGRFKSMRAKGWVCPERLAGTLQLVDARRAGDRDILHLSFSDGLSSVSLFEQRGRLDKSKLTGYRASSFRGGTVYVRDGVPERRVWSSHGMVFTVVADAPAETVDRVVSGLPRPDGERGRWTRLGRGMDRVASWFNPFG